MPAYRAELAPTARATCVSTQCKKEGTKIKKGELRQGTQVTIKEYVSMKWRHWGCVTPQVLHNWAEDSGMDMDLVDGYDTLPPSAQEKVKRSLEEKHVDDEDWNGAGSSPVRDIELNRYDPNRKNLGMFKKTPKKKAGDDDEDGADAETPTKKKKAAPKKRGRAKIEDAEEEDSSPPPKKARGRAKKTATEDGDVDEEPLAPAKKSRARKAKSAEKVLPDSGDAEAEAPDPEPAPAKKSRAKKASSKAADEVEDEPEKPQKRRGRSKKAAAEDD